MVSFSETLKCFFDISGFYGSNSIKREFIVSEAYAKRLERKKQIFREETKTRKVLFTTLITPYGAKKNRHYLSAVDDQLTMDIFFE